MPLLAFISDGGGIGGILYTLRSGQLQLNHYNARGDVVATTDGSGNQSWRGQYDGFGEIDWEVGTRTTRQLSNTKDQDVAGLVNEGFRYRDLETGSFLTRDPLGFVDGPNVYTYVQQNPWTKFDPQGLFWETLWDVGNVIYDAGRFVKNGVEVAAGGAMYAYGHVTGNQHFKAAAGEFTRKNAGELGEATVDIVFDAIAAVVPLVPAGGTKAARLAATHGDEIVDATKGANKAGDTVKTAEALNNGKQAAKTADSAATTGSNWKGPADYSDITDHSSVAPGKPFTQTQKRNIRGRNMEHNDGALRSDLDGTPLDVPSQSQKGVPANMNQAEIDHIEARSNGGSNSHSNAQVLSKQQNIDKSNK